MRVIAGKYKGRVLIGPKKDNFRPTLDRVKESIFNILGQDLIDNVVLDLFCGSGALGIEALSRGAMRATFVDNNKAILNIALKNAVNLKIEEKAKFIFSDVFEYIERNRNIKYHLILADPPYDKKYGGSICNSVVEFDILHQGGILVLERYQDDITESEGLRLVRTLKFGQTEVDFFLREA